MTKNERWHYYDESRGGWSDPVTLDTLDGLLTAGKIEEHSNVVSARMLRRGGMGAHGIPYSCVIRIPMEFSPSAEGFLAARSASFATILAGPNNSGKTLFLRQLLAELDHSAYFLQCNRFSHIDILNTRQVDRYEYRRYFDNFLQNYYTAQQNQENNELNLEQLITNLKEDQLNRLFEIVSNLLGQQFSLKQIDPESRFSPFYVDMDGQNLRLASTGTRLLFSLLGLLFDQRFSVVLIDEPEIGLSPRVQRALATFLYHPETRAEFFPHLKQVFISTHSHLFLDATVFSNNHIVTRSGLTVSVNPVSSASGLHRLRFNLLGNDLEALSLPSAIVVVEGENDQIFLARVFEVLLPDKRISVVKAGGDGEILNKINVLKEAFGDIATGPYRDRLFAVLDARNSASKARLVGQGVHADHIRTWTKNGIEYLYPVAKVARVFRCTDVELSQIDREADPIVFNDIRKSKKTLAQEIADALDSTDTLDSELQAFVQQIKTAVS